MTRLDEEHNDVTNGDTDGAPPTPPRHLHPVDPNEPPYDPHYDDGPTTNAAIANTDAERAVLGALILEPTLAPTLAPHLTPDDFWRPAHADLWTLIHNLANRDEPFDQVTIAQAVVDAGLHKKLPGGPTYLSDLMQGCPNPTQATAYAQIVRDTARLRQLDTIATQLRNTARNATATDASRHLEQAFDDLEQIVTRWGPSTSSNSGLVDLSWLAGGTPPTVEPPTILRRTDGNALFYAGKVNGIFGDPECGKTWIAQAAIVEHLHAGGTAAMIDVDHNGPNHTAARLLLLGATLDHIADPTRFRYYQPDDADELRAAIDDVVRHTPGIVLIDSIGEVFPMLGVNTNDGDEVSTALRQICTRPADTGSCVITIDHLPKGADARSTGFAIGTVAKKRMIRGAYLRAEARLQPAPGQKGLIDLRIEKDTTGELRKTSGGGFAGTFIIDSRHSETDGITRWALDRKEAPKNDDGSFRPTALMEKISRYIEDNDQCTGRDIEQGVKGNRSAADKALKLLIHEGFVSTFPGPRNSRLHHANSLYRVTEDDHA